MKGAAIIAWFAGVLFGFSVGTLLMMPPAPTTRVHVYGPDPGAAQLLGGK